MVFELPFFISAFLSGVLTHDFSASRALIRSFVARKERTCRYNSKIVRYNSKILKLKIESFTFVLVSMDY